MRGVGGGRKMPDKWAEGGIIDNPGVLFGDFGHTDYWPDKEAIIELRRKHPEIKQMLEDIFRR